MLCLLAGSPLDGLAFGLACETAGQLQLRAFKGGSVSEVSVPGILVTVHLQDADARAGVVGLHFDGFAEVVLADGEFHGVRVQDSAFDGSGFFEEVFAFCQVVDPDLAVLVGGEAGLQGLLGIFLVQVEDRALQGFAFIDSLGQFHAAADLRIAEVQAQAAVGDACQILTVEAGVLGDFNCPVFEHLELNGASSLHISCGTVGLGEGVGFTHDQLADKFFRSGSGSPGNGVACGLRELAGQFQLGTGQRVAVGRIAFACCAIAHQFGDGDLSGLVVCGLLYHGAVKVFGDLEVDAAFIQDGSVDGCRLYEVVLAFCQVIDLDYAILVCNQVLFDEGVAVIALLVHAEGSAFQFACAVEGLGQLGARADFGVG